MALVLCPECKKEISNSAKSCPNCGYSLDSSKVQPEKDKKKRKVPLFLKIIICIGIPLIFFSTRHYDGNISSSSSSQQSESYEIMTPRALFKAFSDNEVSAENKYKDKKVALQGRVYEINSSIMGYPTVVFDIGYGIQTVQCEFSKNYREATSTLKKGQTVTLIGTVKFFTLGSLLTLHDCTFAEKVDKK